MTFSGLQDMISPKNDPFQHHIRNKPIHFRLIFAETNPTETDIKEV
jgi:hypothetical protein